jgi:hypothetical protein
VKEKKNEEGLSIRFLEIEIDIEKMETHLPQEKHEKTTVLVESILEKQSVKFKELETVEPNYLP